jgi:hypothetical protein
VPYDAFAQTSSHGDWVGVLAYHIKTGTYGHIELHGLNVLAFRYFKGNICAGDSKATVAMSLMKGQMKNKEKFFSMGLRSSLVKFSKLSMRLLNLK